MRDSTSPTSLSSREVPVLTKEGNDEMMARPSVPTQFPEEQDKERTRWFYLLHSFVVSIKKDPSE
jgi:hypothetical protein